MSPPQTPIMSGWRLWLLGARPRTLPAAVAPVLVGTAAATVPSGDSLSTVIWWRFLCALGVAVFVQVATNYANDYSDGVRGTDDPQNRLGPPRLVGNGLASAGAVKKAMLVSFGLTLAAGTPLVIFVDWRLALVGIAAVAAGWFYTGGPRPYGYAGFGEVFVFVFFGLVATVGAAWVQIESFTALAVVCGIAMGCLATALLVVNNLRDLRGDAAAGKVTLAVRMGDRRTRYLYVALMVLAVLLLPVMVAFGAPPTVALGFIAVVAGRSAVAQVIEGAQGPKLLAVLAATGRTQLVYGVLVAIGLLIQL